LVPDTGNEVTGTACFTGFALSEFLSRHADSESNERKKLHMTKRRSGIDAEPAWPVGDRNEDT
jgi:hypothetical protein